MRQSFAVSLALGACALALTPVAQAGRTLNHRAPLTLAVFGDAPYGVSPTDTSQFVATPAFVDAINADADVSLVLHLGDIHSGKQYCTEAYDRSVYDLWTAFNKPLVYTPGDNEWADCHKAKQGGGSYVASTDSIKYVTDANGVNIDYAAGNPAANLELVRSIFFAEPGRTLGRPMRVTSQAEVAGHEHRHEDEEHGVNTDAKFVENVMWSQQGVLFATVNIPGGSNNGADVWYGAPTMSNAQAQEVATRTGAALRWIEAAFEQAKQSHAQAILLGVQADMWDFDGNVASHVANYKPYVARIAELTKAYGKPVLLLNGDSHTYRSDNPLVAGASCTMETGDQVTACGNDAYASQPLGYNVPNFHRVVVHGSTSPMEWVKLSVDTRVNAPGSANAFGPFSWQRITQP